MWWKIVWRWLLRLSVSHCFSPRCKCETAHQLYRAWLQPFRRYFTIVQIGSSIKHECAHPAMAWAATAISQCQNEKAQKVQTMSMRRKWSEKKTSARLLTSKCLRNISLLQQINADESEKKKHEKQRHRESTKLKFIFRYFRMSLKSRQMKISNSSLEHYQMYFHWPLYELCICVCGRACLFSPSENSEIQRSTQTHLPINQFVFLRWAKSRTRERERANNEHISSEILF